MMGSELIKRGFWLGFLSEDEGWSFYVSRLYKESTTEEVVHQIDQKYIPGGSGGSSQTVVNITLTENPEGESADSPYIIESDLTTSEIVEAFESSNVVAWVYLKNYITDEWMKMYQLNCAACLNLGGDTMVVFTAIMNMGTGANILTLSVTGEEWNYSATPIPQETN